MLYSCFKAPDRQFQIVAGETFSHLQDVVWGVIAALSIARTGRGPDAGPIRTDLLGELQTLF